MELLMEKFQDLKLEWDEITLATNNFDQKNFIGGGGFGKVYKGQLPSKYKELGLVALKRLDRKHGQGDAEFLKEITFLSRFKDRNLISLLGFCIQEKEMILVYEHASRGSLDRHLNSADLTWMQRLKICVAAAKGLNYLHDPRNTGQRLIHCDIKSANILLDEEWNAKVADFGLSKIAPANQQNSIVVTNALGTVGYCDPLFMQTYSLTKESDVYSFGVVLFEVLCGKVCCQISNGELRVLVPTWKKRYEEKKLDEILFPDLKQNMDQASLETFSDIAYQCLKNSRDERPSMSVVVETLEKALQHQKLKLLGKYEQIVRAAVPPLTYNSMDDVKALLFKGFLIDGGTTWFSIDENEQHIHLTSINECVDPESWGNSGPYSQEYKSRFEVGTYNTLGCTFYTRVIKTQYLSPCIPYTVNLIFKCPHVMLKEKSGKKPYISLVYKLNEGEERISIVDLSEKGEDEWLIARLHQFATSHQDSIVDLKIEFQYHSDHLNSLEIEGIEFRPVPLEISNAEGEVEVEQDDYDDEKKKYEEIVKSAASISPLFYTSLQQLKLLLSKGLHLNSGKTWFHVNDKGQHCELISIHHCINTEERTTYYHNYNSRFPQGTLTAFGSEFKARVRAQFLTPLITYSVNLVFKVIYQKEWQPKQAYISLKYTLQGHTKTSVSLADKREDEWWMVELCQYTTEQGITTADLEITFKDNLPYIAVEGIEFLPVEELEKEEDQVLEDMNDDDDDDDIQPPVSSDDSDSVETYWEQKLPINYEDIIKLAKDSVPVNTTKKDLYFIFSKGFLINDGQEWLSVDKNGKKCLMLSPRAACYLDDTRDFKWQSLPESRFGETMELCYNDVGIEREIRSELLSSETRYATYLVYDLPAESDLSEDLYEQPSFEAPVRVMDGRDLSFDDEEGWFESDYWYVFLIGGPRKPVINVRGGKVVVDGNTTCNPSSNRPKKIDLDILNLPRKRRDGWMEVKVWEFQTPSSTPTTTNQIIPIRFLLNSFASGNYGLKGLNIQGIEFRPI